MINEHDLLRIYMKYEANAHHLKYLLKKSIEDFFKKYKELQVHMIEIHIQDNGKYIVINDYTPVSENEHIPKHILREFCDTYGVTCESITQEVTNTSPLNKEDCIVKSNCFTILFEDIRDYDNLIMKSYEKDFLKNKQNILNDLMSLKYLQGYHSGRWEFEGDREDTAHEYLNKMKEFAEEYELEYSFDLQDFIDNENNEEYYAKEEMGYALQTLVKEHLLKLLYE